MKKVHSIILISSSLIAAGASAAVVITTATGVNGADSFVQLGNGTTNYGGGADLTVKYGGNDTSGTTRKGYFRFDVASLTGASVTNASLSLTVGINNGGSTNTTPQNFTLNLYGLNDGATAGGGILGEDWDETLITWDNGPANVVSGAGAGNSVKTGPDTANGGAATLIGSFEVTAADSTGSIVLAASGSNLVDFLNADTNDQVTFIITRTGWSSGGGLPNPSQGGSNLTFRTKENTSGHEFPTLNLDVIPEPSSGLFVLLSCGAGLLRRKRA